MFKLCFSIILKDPFSSKPHIFYSKNDQYYYTKNIDQILNEKRIVSFGFEEAIESARNLKVDYLPEIWDVITIKRLLTGKPKRSFEKECPWTLNGIIGKSTDPKTLKWVNSIIKLKIKPEDIDNHEFIESLLKSFKISFKEMLLEAKEKKENNRYFDIETEIYNIFIKNQLIGIKVSQDKLENRLQYLRKKYYKNIKKLEFDYGFNTSKINRALTWEDISMHLNSKKFESDFNSNFWDTTEFMCESNPFLKLLLNAKNSNRDYNELIKYRIDNYSYIYPEYEIMGTVTGRILINKPGIQYLKKQNRDIFIPNDDHCFLYADFDIFEPGILASLSGDTKLKELYNSGDIYEQLSILIFNNTSNRKLAKKIFLSFMYGMKKDKIKSLIISLSDEDAGEKALRFFSHFAELIAWKSTFISESEKLGFSKTPNGNNRYLENINGSNYSEKRWIPNQLIQGTASLIFKESIIDFNSQFKNGRILIPMHDAILLEVNKNYLNKTRDLVKKIFTNTFKKYCPDIKCNISFEEFSG